MRQEASRDDIPTDLLISGGIFSSALQRANIFMGRNLAGNSINPHIIPIILISYGLLQSPFNLNGV